MVENEKSNSIITEKGFSLVELVVSVAITAILLAGLVPVLQMGFTVWAQQSEVTAMQQDERVILENIAREVRTARRSSVRIVENSQDNRRPMLEFCFTEGSTDITHNYFKYQEGFDLWRIRNTGSGPGYNIVLRNISKTDGFDFYFYNTNLNTRSKIPGSILSGDEVVELVIRSNRGDKNFEARTFASPRND